MSRRYPPGSFVVVPHAAIYDERLTRDALRVLLLLQDHANGHDDLMFPGERRMATDLSMHRRSVQRALRLLEERGYVETIPRTKPGRGKTTNHYRVLFEAESRGGSHAAPAPPEAANPDTRGGKLGGAEAAATPPLHDQNPGYLNSGNQDARAREAADAEPVRSLTPAGLAAGHDIGREGHEHECSQGHELGAPSNGHARIDWDGRWLAFLNGQFPERIDRWRGHLEQAAGGDEALAEDRLIEVAAMMSVRHWSPQHSDEYVYDLAVSTMCEVLRGDERGRDAATLRRLTTC